MRQPARRTLIRSLLDIRLSRLAMLGLGALSAAATVFILSGGSGHTSAQLAALAALRQRPVTVAQAAPASPAPASTAPAPTADAGAGSGTAASSSAGGAGSSDSSGASAGATGDGSSGSSASSDPSSSSTASTPSTTTTSSATTKAASPLPKVRHVFQIVLSTSSYTAAFGRGSAAPYLRSLASKGTLLSGYASLGEGELADQLAIVSGQSPNADTRAGCTTYAEFPAGVTAKADGTVPGSGCVFPETALTVGDQVSSSGQTWKAYVADMGTASCAHPNSGAVDDLALTGTGSGYDTRHNPFIYFHSLLDLGDCATDDVDLGHLDKALSGSSHTATYTFVAPGACADAVAVTGTRSASESSATSTTATTSSSSPSTTSTTATTSSSSPPTSSTTKPAPTTGSAGATTPAGSSPTPSGTTAGCPSDQPVGIAAEDAFVKQWVPRILASAAYRANGVLIIALTGDGARNPGHATRTGALVISRYARRHRTLSTAYGPYSLLRSVEDMLGYTALAHAKSAPSFADKVLVVK